MNNIKIIINTKKAPSAIWTYSQGTVSLELIFVLGQLPIDPNSGEFAIGGVEEQTK